MARRDAAPPAARSLRGRTALRGDVGTAAGCAALVAEAALGGLDVLVNNAGIFPRAPFPGMREEERAACSG